MIRLIDWVVYCGLLFDVVLIVGLVDDEKHRGKVSK